MDKQIFYHHLRLIFTYYTSQGNKQQPLILRQKNLLKFIKQSTLSQLLYKKQSSPQSSPMKSSRATNQYNKSLQVFINSFNKPVGFEDFVKLLAKLIYSTSKDNNNNYNDKDDYYEFEDEQKVQDLYDLCQKDQMLINIFSFLYDQIEHSTQFGGVVLFSQEKEHFNQQAFKTIMKNFTLLKIIYFHYFPKAQKHQLNNLQKIINVLKIVFHQFGIIPQKLSLSEVFLLFFQVVQCKSKSVYEQQFQRILQKDEQIEQKQWSQFTLIQFIKVIIMVANLLALKNTDNKQFQFTSQNIINFLQLISISKGYMKIKSTYKLNQSFFKISRQQLSKRQLLNKDKQIQGPIRFEVKRLNENKSTILLGKIKQILQIVFKSYGDNNNNMISKKQLHFLCRQFKLIPNLISKREIDQIYMRIFLQRQFYKTTIKNVPKQYNKKYEIIEEKQKLLQLIQQQQYGLRYEQFQKVLVYTSQQQDSICKQFTTNQRLVFLLQQIFSQPRFKQLIESQINQNRINTKQIDCSNPKILIKKYIDEQEVLDGFQKDYRLMYVKLRREYT